MGPPSLPPFLLWCALGLLLAHPSHQKRINYQKLAESVLEGQALVIPPLDPSVLDRGAPALEQLFLAANTTFSYHLRVRDLSLVRDHLNTEELNRWTTEKMRELFLVPNYPCPMAARVGEWGEGGKWLCNIFPFSKGFRRSAVSPAPSAEEASPSSGFAKRLDHARTPVVYSVGSRDETSFELAMFKLLGVKPHTFDPSLDEEKQRHMQGLPFLQFHNLGLKGRGRGRAPRSWGSLMRLPEAMEMLQHSYIDVLKIDCELCEHGVMRDLLKTFGRQPPVGQVLMEVHDLISPHVELELLLVMEQLGFRMFHSENNDRYLKAHEVAYIHESLVDPSFWPL